MLAKSRQRHTTKLTMVRWDAAGCRKRRLGCGGRSATAAASALERSDPTARPQARSRLQSEAVGHGPG